MIHGPLVALFKPAIFALLAFNAIIYATAGRAAEGLDALAWFALLVLFEIETRYPRWTHQPHNAATLGLLRLVAAAAIAVAALTFLHEHEWLDATNAWLWIGVVATLELEVRVPSLVARYRRTVTIVSIVLYAALTAVAVVWLAHGEWFDGYDAVLWIAAFALIELGLFKLTMTARAAPGKNI